jgi:hypothetical protein
VNRSRDEEKGAMALANAAPEFAIMKYGGAAHSRSADEEIDLICNHKFV